MEVNKKFANTKNGEPIKIECHVPPLDKMLRDIIEKLHPASDPWKRGWKQRMAGKLCSQCQDKFILGFIGDELVAKMWYTVSSGFATYGAVYISEKHRSNGIAGLVLKYCLEFLDSEKDLIVTYLGVSKPIPRMMYEKAGWIPYNDTPSTCIMRRFKDNKIDNKKFDQVYFKKATPCKVRTGKRSDLPRMEALYNIMLSNCWFGRNFIHGIFTNVAVEAQIDTMFNEVDKGLASCYILEDSKEAILGVAFLRKLHGNRNHIVQFDYFMSPVIADNNELLAVVMNDHLVKKAHNLITCQASCDSSKIQQIKKSGFVQTEKKSAHYQFKNKFFDQITLEKINK